MKIDSYKITQPSGIQKKEMQSDSKANKNKSDSAKTKTAPANIGKIGDVLEMSSDVRNSKYRQNR